MSNVTAYVGRDFGGREHTQEHVIDVTLAHLDSAGIPGATFCECIGYWNGEMERSVRVDLIGCDVDAVHAALTKACADLMQWSILYVVDGRENVFIENDPTAARMAYTA